MGFIDDIILEMNRRIGNLVDPGPNSACYIGSSPFYLKDARIRFDVQKYFIPDSYLWDIENASSSTAYCPDGWNTTYTNLVHQRLNEYNVREGINVCFGNESSAYFALLIDRTVDDFFAVASAVDCSQFPRNSPNFGFISKVALTNEFLAFRYGKYINPLFINPNAQWDNSQAVFAMGRLILHELGHSLGLGHSTNTPNCSQNIMRENLILQGNYLQPDQMGKMLNALHTTSIRKYVSCAFSGAVNRVINNTQVWNFNTNIYTDIVLEPGANLTICGTVFMPKNGTIHVKRGAKLILDGGTISFNRPEYEDCPEERWYGIYVEGNNARPHSEVDINSPAIDDPGILILQNGARVEYARQAIMNWKKDDPFNKPYIGGYVLAEGAFFENNIRSAAFLPNQFSDMSRFDDCSFTSTEGDSETGIVSFSGFGLTIDHCTFNNLGEQGVLLFNASANILNGCHFSEMKHGIYAVASSPLGEPINVGSEDENMLRNVFTQNECGVYAAGVFDIRILNNDFTSNNFGVAVSGETGVTTFQNDYNNLLVGENYEQSGVQVKLSECNVHNNLSYGIRALGDNTGLGMDGNSFNTDFDFFLRNRGATLGKIKNQGSANDAVENLFSSASAATHIYGLPAQTQTFFYYYPNSAPSGSRLIPKCAINGANGCAVSYNFWRFSSDNPNQSECLSIPKPIACNSKICLNQLYAEIFSKKTMLDGGDKNSLLTAIAQAPFSNATYQSLLNASPYLTDEVLLSVLNSTMSSTRKGSISLANAPLTDAVMVAAAGKVTSSTYNSLVNLKTSDPVSDRNELTDFIFELESQKNYLMLQLIQDEIKTGDFTEAEQLAGNDDSPLAAKALFSLYLQQNKIAQADALYHSLPNSTQEEQDFLTISAIQLEKTATPGFSLNATQEAELLEIAEGTSPQAGYAQALLYELEGLTFMPELPENQNGQKLANPNFELDAFDNINEIRLFPNPAKEIFEVFLPVNWEGATIIILDNLGKQTTQRQISTSRISKIHIGDLSPGFYYLVVEKDGYEPLVEKLIIY